MRGWRGWTMAVPVAMASIAGSLAQPAAATVPDGAGLAPSQVTIGVTELVGQDGEALVTASQINERGQVIGTMDDPSTGAGRGGAVWRRGRVTRLAEGRWTVPLDISERGQVVGFDVMGFQGPIGFPLPRGFTWANGQWTLFDPDCVSAAVAVNDRGQVAGFRSSGPGQCPREVVIWSNGGAEIAPLDYEIYTNISTEMDINDRGQTLVASRPWAEGTVTDSTVSLVWQPGRDVVDVGTLGGLPSHGLDLNERGQVAGWSKTATGATHAFLWRRGEMVDLGTLGGDASRPGVGEGPPGIPMSPQRPTRVLNERGHVVGTSDTASGQQHAFLWQRGEMVDLGTLGGPSSAAVAVNDHDQVIGYSTTASGAVHAFLWQRGEMVDLGALAGEGDSLAVDINDRGQIVGVIEDDTRSRGVLWTVRR
jgi:probable HAF family extracellular repeat protein